MFNLPNLFTAANLLCGITSILMAFSGRLDWACYFIYFAALFDFFDGFLARKLKISSELGKQLDSLADMVTFGVAPGILAFVMLCLFFMPAEILLVGMNFTQGNMPENLLIQKSIFQTLDYSNGFQFAHLVPFAGLIIPFFSLFRLAKFNIDTRQSESFIGLPTPANTIFFTAFPLLYLSALRSRDPDAIIFEVLRPEFFIPIILVMSLLLIAELPLFALKFKDFSWKNNQVRFVFLAMCAVLIPLLFAWSLPIIIILYLLLSVVENKRIKNAT